jgi:hypothetical protein
MRNSAATSARRVELRVLFIFEGSFRPVRILPPADGTHGAWAGFQEANERIAGHPRRNARIMKEKRGEVKEECGEQR